MSEENASNCLPTFNSYQKAHGLYDAASKLFGENKFEEAIKLYSQAIEVKPDFTSAYFNRPWPTPYLTSTMRQPATLTR